MAAPARRPTSTSAFGVGRRESHDSSPFYARFSPPQVSLDDTVGRVELAEPIVCGDARHMTALPDDSVALVVTSPPYFVGKDYERVLDDGRVPASYKEYLALLRAVFAECRRVLEPGGRIAVNVANLGRKPYRSLSADVIGILQDDLGLLLRGEVVWVKARGAAGSCAWGSFRTPANPVLRDVSERVIVASKGRFDRARSARQRADEGLPSVSTLTTDEFLQATLDVWEIPAERASRVGHPAPFPVELPQRLIELYTYEDDLVLDPFCGSGTTAVAAVRTGRRPAGWDLEPAYVDTARRRLAAERLARVAGGDPDEGRARARAEGQNAAGIAAAVLGRAGFHLPQHAGRDPHLPAPAVADLMAVDRAGRRWYVQVAGGFTTVPGGLTRTDQAWAAVGRAHVARAHGLGASLLLGASLPRRGSEADRILRAASPDVVFDVLGLLDDASAPRLGAYAGGTVRRPQPGFWTAADVAACPTVLPTDQ